MSNWHSGQSFDPAGPVQSPIQGSPSDAQQEDDLSPRKRKRSSLALQNGDDGSPTTSKQRHQPGVKRACNDCRQQKLRCNVDAGPPYKPCSRCIKHNLSCSIDNDFKRLGKRAQHDEMARELEQCKDQLAQLEAMGVTIPKASNTASSTYTGSYATSPTGQAPVAQMSGAPFMGPNEAAASRSLLDLSQGYQERPTLTYPSITPGTSTRTLGNVTLTDQETSELFSVFFNCYHQFLPILSPETPYSEYYKHHPLLHWTVLAIACRRYDSKPGLLIELQQPLESLLWTTLSGVPQTYHIVKALALLCTWPLPNSSTSGEPTMMLTGAMFQLAMQYGLHRPSHAQDFSRFRIELREEEITDRLHTWATVNIVAQNVATGQGQPPLSRWAWYTYGLHLDQMKPELHTRCQIEKFCDTVTRTLFTMQRDHIVEVDKAQRGLQIDMYARELGELELTTLSTRSSPIDILYLKAAALHLRLSAFFDKPSQPNYLADLRNVYIAASSMLTAVNDLPANIFMYLPRYIEQMMLAAATTLLKLLNSFYATHVDASSGRILFSKTVAGLRKLSVRSNDLPQRLAEVMAQLWQTSGESQQGLFTSDGTAKPADESLQLRVRCRSSLSVLYDAIWRWRQQVGQTVNLEHAVDHPTAVPGGTNSRNTPQPPMGGAVNPLLGSGLDGGLDDPMSWDGNFGGNAVFDPLSWALDGNLQLQLPSLGGLDGMGGYEFKV
ncbi:uncharacterized protein LTR77_011209 [Saxophila tyrrhenica]|uniref:Zn(2)-C6 fungal-type domain-containing protein n=1 Tax=Saxophila tyrrhenica TaxID=1690608 RepID=A0AAV9NX31_9PEZI|nr:hypothetical protein LTR77_011209 [Saxophila tyrrhenica]